MGLSLDSGPGRGGTQDRGPTKELRLPFFYLPQPYYMEKADLLGYKTMFLK